MTKTIDIISTLDIIHPKETKKTLFMKRIVIFITLQLTLFMGQFAMNHSLNAQPAPVKQAAKSVFTLTTFRADGSLLASSHGVFIGNQGEALSDLTPFLGARRAVVVDANGKQMNVERILGVNDIYDMCRFKVAGKTTAAQVATTVAPTGSSAWLLPYAMGKNPLQAVQTTVKNAETFMEKYGYYVFDISVPENAVHCPFVNEQGQVLGLLQLTSSGNTIHAASAFFGSQLRSTALEFNGNILGRIGIPVALPEDRQQAQLALLMSGGDSLKQAAYVGDFISLFPDLPDGYQRRAQMEVDAGLYDAAAKDMETVINKSEKKDEGHYAYSQLIYQKELYHNRPYAPWSFDKAIEEAQQAFAINPQPVYQHQEAQIRFSKKEYQKAYDMFMQLTKTPLRSPEIFYEAAHSQQMMQPNDTAFIALIDSAIIACDSINRVNPAPYILARAQAWEQAGQYRKAVGDYNIYAYIMRPTLTAQFFYSREQCESKAKLWQQALNDITIAIELDKQQPVYYAEKANLLLRVNQIPDAIDIARQCIAIDPDYPDGYLILGLALIQQNNKAEGIQQLQKAKELGSEQAQPLIDKYQ